MTATRRPALLALSVAELAARIVPAGQPWCENSLDGPATPPEESRAAQAIEPYLAELDFETELVGATPTRANLIARRTFGPGPTLLLNDHLDTYPAGPPSRWTKCADPFSPVTESDRMYARGTSDTRGNLAALLHAVGQVCVEPPESGTLLVALTVDEERNGVHGAQYLLEQHGLTADAAITVEPTAWTEGAGDSGIGIAVQHTGHALVDVLIRGRSSHIWRPDTGVNAAHHLLDLLRRLPELPHGWGASVVGLNAGESGMAQFTPLTAAARIAVVGIGPGVARAEVTQALTTLAARVVPAHVTAEVSYAPGPTFVSGTLTLDGAEPVVAALAGAYAAETGEPARLYCKPAYCDTIRFRHAGLPAVTFGPGDDGWAVYDESISIARMELAASVLSGAIRRFLCGG